MRQTIQKSNTPGDIRGADVAVPPEAAPSFPPAAAALPLPKYVAVEAAEAAAAAAVAGTAAPHDALKLELPRPNVTGKAGCDI